MRTRVGSLVAAMAILVGACGGAGSPTVVPTLTPPTYTLPPIVTPAPTTSPAPSSLAPSPTPQPSAPTPTSSASSTGVAAASLPVRADAASVTAALAPAPDGRLYVAVPAREGTVLALLDARGHVRRGWPVLLRGASDCELDADPADGSIRAVCTVAKSVRAYALDVGGRLMAGWPVDLQSGSLQSWRSDAVAVVDGDLAVLLISSGEGGQNASVTRVSPDGSARSGTWVRGVGHSGCCSVVGPDGTAYVQGDGEIWAITVDGVRPGFPVRIDGWASAPAFGPDGRLYMTADDPDEADGSPSSQVVALAADGRTAPGWPVTLPVDTWTGYGDPTGPPFPPVVAADGTVYVTGWTGRMDRTVSYALNPSGARRAGWPYRADASIRWGRPSGVTTCQCEPCTYPGLFVYTPPTGGPDGSLLVNQIAAGSTTGGNRLVAVRADGEVRAGWPVTLDEKNSWWAGIANDGDRAVFAYAVEPAGTRANSCSEKYTVHAGTVVALDGHGDPIYTTTVVAP